MKRLLALGLSLALILSLSACQGAAGTPSPELSQAASASAPEESAQSSADPADASQAPADVSALLAQGLEASASASAPAPVEEPEERDVMRGPRTFGLSMPQNPTLTQAAVAEALQKRLEAVGDSLIVAEPAENAEAQQAQLNSLVSQQVSAIFLCPVDAEAMEEAVAALSQQQVSVFGFGDWDYIPEGMVSMVRSDDYNAGYVCGIDLAERCPNGGDVLVLERGSSDAMTERAQGFIDAAEESGVDLEIVDELELEGSGKSTKKAVSQALKESSQVVGIFAASDLDAQAALKAVAGTSCLVYGGDGSPELKAQLAQSQNLGGLGAQSPKGIAKVLVQSANDHLDGEAVEEEQSVGTFLITTQNVEKYGVDGWQ